MRNKYYSMYKYTTLKIILCVDSENYLSKIFDNYWRWLDRKEEKENPNGYRYMGCTCRNEIRNEMNRQLKNEEYADYEILFLEGEERR